MLSVVIYVHCVAGCDRTGQFVASYRLQYDNNNVTDVYSMDCNECGRCPNRWSTVGIEWFCYCENLQFPNTLIGNCTHIANCKVLGSECSQL